MHSFPFLSFSLSRSRSHEKCILVEYFRNCNGGGDGGDDGDINNLAVKIKLEANEFNEAFAILL